MWRFFVFFAKLALAAVTSRNIFVQRAKQGKLEWLDWTFFYLLLHTLFTKLLTWLWGPMFALTYMWTCFITWWFITTNFFTISNSFFNFFAVVFPLLPERLSTISTFGKTITTQIPRP